jgi:hypothetical protein
MASTARTTYAVPSAALQSMLDFDFDHILPIGDHDPATAHIGANVDGDDSLVESFWIYDVYSVRVAKAYFALLCQTFEGWPVRVTVISHDGDDVYADFQRDEDGTLTE